MFKTDSKGMKKVKQSLAKREKARLNLEQKIQDETKKYTRKDTNLRRAQQTQAEDMNMRAFLRALDEYEDPRITNKNKMDKNIKHGFDLFRTDKKYADKDIDELISLWNHLPPFNKKILMIKSYGLQKNAAYNRPVFTAVLSKLDEPLLKQFIQNYLAQPTEYNQFFYNIWSKDADVADKVRTLVRQADNYDELYDNARNTELRKESILRAIEFAESKGVNVDDANSYYEILDAILAKTNIEPVKYDKYRSQLNKLINKDLIKYAKDLGVDNAENLTLADLISRLRQKERIKLDRLAPPEEVEEDRSIVQLEYKEELASVFNEDKVRTTLNDLKRADLVQLARSKNINYATLESTQIIDELIKIYRDESTIVNSERVMLAEKLSQLQGLPLTAYRDKNVEELREEYEMEAGKLPVVETKDVGYIVEDVEKLNYNVQKCANVLKRYRWIKPAVKQVWLSFPNKEEPRYIVKDISLELTYGDNKLTFYQANSRFNVLKCLANKRSQNGIVLKVEESDNTKEFIVGYTVRGSLKNIQEYGSFSGYAVLNNAERLKAFLPIGDEKKLEETGNIDAFIVQGEKMFNDEKVYMSEYNISRLDRLEQILNQRIDKTSINISQTYLSKNLLDIAPHIKDYKDDSVYMGVLMNSLIKPTDTNRELFTSIANIVAYLKFPQAKIFRKRIQKEYYLPDILAILSMDDKLPEYTTGDVLLDADRKRMVDYITDSIDREVNILANKVYSSENPTHKKEIDVDTVTKGVNLPVDYFVMLGRCENPEDIKDNNPEDIIFYDDSKNNKQYCFPITLLLERFSTQDFTNPKTGEPFTKSFIGKVTMLDVDLSQEGFEQKKFNDLYNLGLTFDDRKDDVGDDIKDIIPNMWDIILEDIDTRTKNKESYNSDLSLSEDEAEMKFGSMSTDRDSEEEESDDNDDESSESFEEAVDKSVDEFIKKPNPDKSDKITLGFNSPPADSPPADTPTQDTPPQDTTSATPVTTGNCEKCGTSITDPKYKSIIMNGDDPKLVLFCSIRCFEDKNWPSAPKKGKLKRKKRRSS